jgi:DNA-binding transcriptional ArsR family regulator
MYRRIRFKRYKLCFPHSPSVLLYLGSWLIVYMKTELVLRALANDRRLQILDWLKQPRKHFRPQVDGDLVEDGVCGVLIAEKLGVSQPTASEHMKILLRAGLVRAKRIKQWTFYRRDELSIRKFKQAVMKQV